MLNLQHICNTDLVPHYGEIIHAQLGGVHADLPQSLSSVGVQQDPQPLSLPVQGLDPLADLLEWLAGGKHIRLDQTLVFLLLFLFLFLLRTQILSKRQGFSQQKTQAKNLNSCFCKAAYPY